MRAQFIQVLAAGVTMLLLPVLPTLGLAPPNGGFDGSYQGEVVVHSIGESGILVALDELGEGAATKVFVVGVGHDLQNTISLRSAGARIQRRDDTLYVALPREHVLVVFSRGRIRSAASVGAGTPTGKSLLPWARTEVTTIDDVTMLAEYSGKLRMNLPLDDAQQGSFGPGLEAVFAAGQTPQNQPGPTDGGSGGGCAASCTVSCRDGGACNVSCPTHQCAMCTCVGGTSCYCF